ncbi:MAG: FtsW/RodA/SpoVE family cell cycle protein, partial [Pseudomonadota bacterium]
MAGNISFSRRQNLVEKLTRLPWFMLTTIIAIATFGTAILVSATHGDAANSQLASDHAIRFVVTLISAIGLAVTPIRIWSWVAYPAYLGAMALLIGVEVAGVEAGGAQRWLQVGPVRVQPSELMKIALLLALARYYHRFLQKGPASAWVHVGAFVIIACPVALILKQPDLGTSLLLAATGGTVIFFAGLSMKVITAAIGLVVIGAPTAYFFALADYQKARVQTFLDPSRDPLGAGYQLQQAKIAIGSGGVSGKGYMQGTQSQLEYIPEQHTD